ncbi:MAG: hypothetical protein HY717_22455 [Planctomycetes bacterium]|nr:hypothetical protein [Planctomycetota bacterium]
MQRTLKIALAAFLACGCAALPRREGGSKDEEKAVKSAESFAPSTASGFIDLDFQDRDLHEVLEMIGRKTGVKLGADPEIREKVTLRLEKIPWRDALAILARQVRCQVIEESDRLFRLTRPLLISMEFQDADLKDVLRLIAKEAGANIVIPGDLQGKVSLRLEKVPWKEALDTVAKTAGCILVYQSPKTIRCTLPRS